MNIFESPGVASTVSTANIAKSVTTAVSYFVPCPNPNLQATVIGIGTIPVAPLLMPFAGQFSAADLYVSNSYSATNAASSMAHTVSAFVAIYTNNASTLSLASSGSQSYAFTVTGSSSSVSFQGLKNLTVPVTLNMTPGNYWYAASSSTASVGNAIAGAFSNVVNSMAGNISGYVGVFGQSTAASQQPQLGFGQFSVSSAAFPAAIGFTDISANGNTGGLIVNLKNYSA